MTKKTEELVNVLDNLFGKSYRTADEKEEIKFIPTDIEEINTTILSCGGLPCGNVIEIAGEPGKGKSTFVQWFAGQVQKRDGKVCWFEAEPTFSSKYAVGSGINTKELVLPEFGLGEDLLYKVKLAIASNFFDMIVIDSQDAVKPSALRMVEAKALSMKEKLMRSSMWADFYRDIIAGYSIKDKNGKLILSNKKVYEIEAGKEITRKDLHKLSQKKCCLVMVSHLVPKVGVVFGKPFDSSGSNEMKYHFGLRVWLLGRKPIMGVKKKQEFLKYSIVRLKVEKVKVDFLQGKGECEVIMTPEGMIKSLEEVTKEEIELPKEE